MLVRKTTNRAQREAEYIGKTGKTAVRSGYKTDGWWLLSTTARIGSNVALRVSEPRTQ